MNKQKILVLILTSTLLTGVLCYNFYQSIYGEFITKDFVVFIGSFDTVNDIQKTITISLDAKENTHSNKTSKFNWLADQKNYKKPKAGKYIALSFYEHLRDAVLDQTGWSSLPAILIKQHLREGTLKVIKYNRAMNWQSYGEVVENEARRGTVVKWLSEQLETYLFDESD